MSRTITTGRSCLECHRRKIKCDRSEPCSYCVRVKIQCRYPPRHSSNKSNSDGDVAARIDRIERTLQSLERSLSHIWEVVQPNLCSHSTESIHRTERQETWDEGRQHVDQNSSRGRSDHSTEHDLDTAWSAHIEEPRETSRWHKSHGSPLSSLFDVPSSEPTATLHPPPATILFLWQKYIETVDPILKVFHALTVQKHIMKSIRGQADLDLPFGCLMFAIYYAAVVTMPAEECRTEFNEDKHELLKRYRTGVENSLSQADLLSSFDITVLQAFVIYLICGRCDEHGPDVNTLVGVAIAIAVKIGLHRDGDISNLSPFQIEIRRRLWWQIVILDVRTAEDHDCDPRILDSSFNTRFPSNVNDASLDPDMSTLPHNRPERTEMLFSLVRLEVSNFARRMVFSDQFCRANAYPALGAAQKCKAIDGFRQRIEKQYLWQCDKNLPLDFVTAASSRLILVKLKLSVSKPRTRQNQTVLMRENFRKICVEILQRARSSRNYDKGKHWLWLFQTYIEWDALSYLLIHLSLVPRGDGVTLAWQSVDEIYFYWKNNAAHHRNHRWIYIEELRSKALLARAIVPPALAQWGSRSDDSNGQELSDTISVTTQQQVSYGVSKHGISERANWSSEQESRSPKRRLQPPVSRSAPQEDPQEDVPRMWALANAAAAATATDTLSQPETLSEPADIPSSGTACQWSAGIFEKYFQVLETEQDVSAPWL